MEIDAVPGRLIIEKVVLNNFKSYAGETIIGPFHQSLTSIVGPNGSGKSNLLESLLFAFGKRARKIRLKKLSELIHHSRAHPNVNQASVTVYLTNITDIGSSYIKVPNSDLILCRTVSKNNTTEYKINNKTCSYEEVTNTLKTRGIDLEHNRFLILQGEVEQIAMMNPKAVPGEESKTGLLEYLEEIIGTDHYVSEIEKSEKALEILSNDVSCKKLKLDEAMKSLVVLEEPKNQAIFYINLEKESFCFKSLSLRLTHHKLNNRLGTLSSSLAIEDENVSCLSSSLTLAKSNFDSALSEYKQKVHQIQALNKLKLKLEHELKEIISEDTKTVEEIKQIKNGMNQSVKDKENNEKRCEEIAGEIGKIKAELPRMETKLVDVNKLRVEKEREFESKSEEIKKVTKELQKRKAEIEAEIRPIRRELIRIKAERQAKAKEIEIIIQDIQSGIKEKEELETSLLSLQQKLAQNHLILQNTEEENIFNENHYTKYSKSLSTLQESIDSLLSFSKECQQKLSQHESESKRSLEAKGQLGEILKAKLQKQLKGLFGRLGDLGSISPQYDTAVSSAISYLDFYVVDSVVNGTKLIEFSRAHNLGKVNILVLEKIKIDDSEMTSFNLPDRKAVRLYDELTISNDRLRKVFYFTFGNLLCTDNLDDARRIAFGAKRFRVVTKDGDIINTTGEMRGFARPLKGKMKLIGQQQPSYSEEDIEGVKDSLKETNEKLEKLNSEKAVLMNDRNNWKVQERQGVQKAKVLKNEIEMIEERIKLGQERLRVLSQRSVVEMKKEVEELEIEVEDIGGKIKRFECQIDERTQITLEIEGKIEEAAGNHYKSLKTTLSDLVAEEEVIEKELTKNQSKLTQRQKDYEKYYKQLKAAENELQNAMNSLEVMKTKREVLKLNAETKADELQKLHPIESEYAAELQILETQKNSMLQELENVSQRLQTAKDKQSSLLSQIHETESNLKESALTLERALENFNSIDEEYTKLLQSVTLDESIIIQDHLTKRNRFAEEREALKRPLSWQPSEEELEELLMKTQLIESIISSISQELAGMQPNLKAIENYKSIFDDKCMKEANYNEAKFQEAQLKTLYIELKGKRFNEFTRGFREISEKLREMYRMLTHGGNAELEYADSTDPFGEGVVFTVRPPSKSWKKMANLSGGEKTLSSLALVFALHHYKPNALYVMDEVDAALDFQNVEVVAAYIKAQTTTAQFIVVSLRYQMFEAANLLVGIYKTRDMSHCLCVSPNSLRDVNFNRVGFSSQVINR